MSSIVDYWCCRHAPSFHQFFSLSLESEELQEDLPHARHAEGTSSHAHSNQLPVDSPEWRRKFRCGFVYAAQMQAATPVLRDVDGDGRLDVALVIQHAAIHVDIPAITMYFINTYQPRLTITMDTLEDLVIETYGKGAINFSQFLPPDQQPWTQYMGQHEDGVYSL